MKLYYKGRYNLDPASLPHLEHKPGAVKFKEAESSSKLAVIANIIAVAILVLCCIPPYLILGDELFSSYWQIVVGILLSFVTLLPHELLHAICFKKEVFLYTNLKQGMMFVVGPEDMSKGRFIFMSALPNIIFGLVPYIIGLIFPECILITSLGILCLSMGAGDYYNIFNALTQMPPNARTYLYQFNSYWYIPERTKQ